jgi:hypothetical protein
MPDPKKTIVKVAKKSVEKPVSESNASSGLTKENISKINETSDINKKRREIEGIAKNDSIVGAKKAKFEGKDLVDQRRAGNKTANETRKEGGVPQVTRGRSTNTEPDKYYSGGYSALTSDSYSRNEPLEKDMPIIKKTMVKVKKA